MLIVLGGFPKLKMGGHAVIVATEEQAVAVKTEHKNVIVTPDMKVKAMELFEQGYTMYEKEGDKGLGIPLTVAADLKSDVDYWVLLPIAGG